MRLRKSDEKMCAFIRWLAEHETVGGQLEFHNETAQWQQEPPEQQNQLADLYFASEVYGSTDRDEERTSPKEQVIRTGSSAKVLRPKTKSSFNSERPAIMDWDVAEPAEPAQPRDMPIQMRMQPQPIKNERKALHQRAESKDFQNRPRIIKKNSDRQSFESSNDKHSSKGEKVEKPQKSRDLSPNMPLRKAPTPILSTNMDQPRKPSLPTGTQSRKNKSIIFTLLSHDQKRRLVEWLININLLNNLALDNFSNLHVVCRNGLIFPQLINLKKSRQVELYYSRKPKKQAEIHANYKRVFDYLSSFANFQSNLLYRYQYFVPQPKEQAFWQLLNEIHNLFTKKKNQKTSSPKAIKSTKDVSQAASIQDLYRNIRFGSSSRRQKDETKHEASVKRLETAEKLKQIEQKPPQRSNNLIDNRISRVSDPRIVSNQRSSSVGSRKNSQQSYEKPPIPIQQDFASKIGNSYSQLKLKKQQMNTSTAHTPSKLHQNSRFDASQNSSLSHTRLSLKQTPQKTKEKVLPKITLQMQMTCLAYLKEHNYPLPTASKNKQFFQDPIRNGTLLVLLVCQRFNCKAQCRIKPKSIEDCRENHQTALKIIHKQMPGYPQKFLNLTQGILKGNRNLFYGIVYHVIKRQQENSSFAGTRFMLKTEPNESQQGEEEEFAVQYVQDKLKMVKSFEQIRQGLSNGILLTQIASNITKRPLRPVYQQPQYLKQCEANISKALEVLLQFKIISQNIRWKVKKFIDKDQDTIYEFFQQLRGKTKKTESRYESAQPVSFSQLLMQQRSQNYNTLNTTFDNAPRESILIKPLETTMAHGAGQSVSENEKNQDIQVPWMKKLGFTCSLNINSGVILCRLIQKLTMKSMQGIHYAPHNKAEMLSNIRKVMKEWSKSGNAALFETLTEQDILNADTKKTMEIYALMREAYRHSYAFKEQKKPRIY